MLQDNIESQDNVESNTEVNGFQEEDASDTNQTSSTSPSSDLFEDNNENAQLQILLSKIVDKTVEVKR
jgi:hypothetical protein